MKGFISREVLLRERWKGSYIRYVKVSALLKSSKVSYKEKYFLRTLLLNDCGTFFTRLRIRCLITGRARAVYKRFKISRFPLRILALKGLVRSISKSSW